MTKRVFAIPALALSITLVSATLAPAAFAQGRTVAAPSVVAQPSALVTQADPQALVDDMLAAFLDALSATAGMATAVISGALSGTSQFTGDVSDDDTVVAQADTAASNSAATTAAAAQAAVGSARNAGADVANFFLDIADFFS